MTQTGQQTVNSHMATMRSYVMASGDDRIHVFEGTTLIGHIMAGSRDVTPIDKSK
jgi:hypothetical protein